MPCVDCATDIETRDGDRICQSCAPDNNLQCPGCARWHRRGSYCLNCSTCDRCDDTAPLSDTIETTRGSTICAACRQNWYWQCGTCDGWNRDGLDCGNGCCDPDYCECEECRRDDGLDDLVHDYYYKPSPVFHGSDPLFLGMEIEIETPDYTGRECAEIAYSHLDDLGYLKLDSSIGDGFEIVTHPMSYAWVIENFPWRMLTRLSESGCAATANTGIHVHISRAGFDSPCHIYRWMKLIYRNQHQVEIVARRSSPDWAAFTDYDREAVKHYAKGARGERYRAINTNNPDTFELRVFASSLDPREVQAALAFAAASVEYTRQLTVAHITGGGWTWPAFAAWLTDRPEFEPLTHQLEVLQCAC